MTIDPIHQFNIDNLFKIGQIGDHAIYFTNSSAYMLVAVALISILMIGGAAAGALVPGRFQSMAELSYEFVAATIRNTAGADGMRFFPLVFSIFMLSGIPIFVMPLVVFIEIFSFFLRPVSHSVRLFANMLAGHIALKVFAG